MNQFIGMLVLQLLLHAAAYRLISTYFSGAVPVENEEKEEIELPLFPLIFGGRLWIYSVLQLQEQPQQKKVSSAVAKRRSSGRRSS